MKITPKLFNLFCITVYGCLLLQSCSVSKQIDKKAQSILIHDSVISSGHIGISIYEPATNLYWYNYNAEKYFVPASNVKLFTLYAGMKYLGDSLVGLRYSGTVIKPTGDPTFLHPAFLKQPVFDFLKKQNTVLIYPSSYGYGKGWALDDYMEAFMPVRSDFPVYGNLITIKWIDKDSVFITPKFFETSARKQKPWIDGFNAAKSSTDNNLFISEGNNKIQKLPFSIIDFNTIIDLIKDTISDLQILGTAHYPYTKNEDYKVLHSQPTDSLLTPMMHNSDNFFAEQTLLMASNEHLGYMSDEAIIDTLLKTDLKDIPQKPGWVDGSGLSRYNQFTPRSFVYLLNKLNDEFGLNRLKKILPTGGEGTLKNYFRADSGFIYAKTGSLSGQFSLSGYLITRKNKLLLFSVLANNISGNGSAVRRAYEHFIKEIREKY